MRLAPFLGGVALCAALLAAGCGYQLSGYSETLPGGVRSLSIGPIDNRTRTFGLEKTLAFALEREVVRRGKLRLVETPGSGDAVLRGTIRDFNVSPVSFDTQDEALQYQVAMVVDLSLRRNSDGATLWQTSGLLGSEEYSATARVVVTSSSQFQRDTTLEPRDLNLFTDTQLAESTKRQAVERLVQNLARDAYALMSEDF